MSELVTRTLNLPVHEKPILALTEDRFNEKKFNANFDKYLDDQEKAAKKKEADELEKLEKIEEAKKIHQMTLADILINFKNSLFGLTDDLLEFKFTMETFTKENRLLYLGMFIVLFMVFIYIIQLIVGNNDEKQKPTQLVEIKVSYDKNKPAVDGELVGEADVTNMGTNPTNAMTANNGVVNVPITASKSVPLKITGPTLKSKS